MNLNKIKNIDVKNILSLKELKKDIKFTKNELIEGEVLKQEEKFLLVKLAERGIIKAYSDIPNLKGRVLFKVLKIDPYPVLKVLNLEEQTFYNDVDMFFKQFEHIDIENFLDKFSDIKKQIFISKDDFLNFELDKKLKDIPEKLGLNFEKQILRKNIINKETLKFKLLTSENKNFDSVFLNIIQNNQKLNNENLFLFPLFFQEDIPIKRGYIVFKKKKLKDNLESAPFTVVILLEFNEDKILQIAITKINKNITLNFISNNYILIENLKKNFEKLFQKIENLNIKIISHTFNYIDKSKEDILNNLKNFIFQIDEKSLIDIKT